MRCTIVDPVVVSLTPLQAKTLMFVMVSPSELQLRESLASLAFGTRCKTVAFGPFAANAGHAGQPLLPLPLPRPVQLSAAAYDQAASDDNDVDGSSVDGDAEGGEPQMHEKG
jgi:hypothetical protein